MIIQQTGTNEDDEDEEEIQEELSDDDDDDDEDDAESSYNKSPLSGKAEKAKFHHPEPVIGLRDEDMTIDEVDADETMTLGSEGEQSEQDENEHEEGTSIQTSNADDATEEGTDDDEEDWMPPPKQSKTRAADDKPLPKEAANLKAKSKASTDVGSLQKKMDILCLFSDEDKENISDQIASEKHVSEDDISESPPAKVKRCVVGEITKTLQIN